MTYDTREDYITQIIHQQQTLDFADIAESKNDQALHIEDVFIGLQAEVEVQPSPRGFKERVRKYQLDHERRNVGKGRPEKTTHRQTVNQALAENLNLAVLGDPGAGKTTLLKYITVAFAKNHPEWLGLKETRLPIFIRLYDYVTKRTEYPKGEFSLLDYFRQFASEQLQLNLPDHFFENALESGDCCICLDGLDVLNAVGLRRELATAIEALVDRFPRNRYIVASRFTGYENAPLDRREFVHLTIQPIGADDIKLFIEKWCSLRNKDSETRQSQTAHLTQAIFANERIKSLATNPLILTIIALEDRIDRDLPQERVKIYDRCVNMLIENSDKEPGDMNRNLRRRLLEKLAYWMHSQPSIPPIGALEGQLRHFLVNDPKLQLTEAQVERETETFLTHVRSSGGLMVEHSTGLYKFSHLILQEFLAACDIERRLAHSSEAIWKEIQPHLHDARWREVILLLVGLLNRFEEHNTELIGHIFNNSDPYEAVIHRNLFLAARALADHAEVGSNLRNQILDSLLKLAASQEMAGWDAFAPLGALQLDQRAALGVLALAQDEKAIVGTRLFAAQALGQLGRTDDEARILLGLAHDEKVHADVRSTATQALGQLGNTSPVVLNGLLELAQNEQIYAYVRSDAAQALGRIGYPDPAVLTGLISLARNETVHERVRRSAAYALGRLKHNDQSVLTELLALAQSASANSEVRCAAAQALGRIDHASQNILSGLLDLAQNEEVDQAVRCDAAESLGQLGWAEHATRILLALARDENASFWVRSDAAGILARLGRVDEAASVLLALVRDENVDPRVRSGAADVMGRLSKVDDSILQGLLALAKDEKVDVRLRSDAAQSLGELGWVDQAAKILIAFASDETVAFWVRSDAAESLGELNRPQDAASILLHLAHDEKINEGGRSAAVQALGQLGYISDTVLNGLLALAQDEKVDAGVRSDAAQALGQLGHAGDVILSGLLALVQNEKDDAGVRSDAAQALGQLKHADQAVLKGLSSLARDEKVDAWVRIDAAQALSQLGRADESVLTGLLALIRDEKRNISMRNAAYYSLKNLLGEGK